MRSRFPHPGRITDTTGLGLVPSYPLAHANRGREEPHARLIAELGDRHEFVRLRDDEALIVKGHLREKRASRI